MTTPGKTSFTILNLNFDVLSTLASHMEAEDLLSWGMTCKKFYHSINSQALWANAALRLQADCVALPLPYGTTVENCDLKALIKAASKASRLQRNLADPKPRLYSSTVISPPILRFKDKDLRMGHVDNAAYIFDGRWILYRWNKGFYARHVEATRFKEVFDIPIVEYASWSFGMEQLSEDVALVTMKNDVVNVWSLMEITFGKDKAMKPRIRPIGLGDPTHLNLVGSGFAVVSRDNQPALYDCRRHESVALEHAYSDQQHYIYKNGILFSVLTREGVFAIVAQRVDTRPTMKLHPKKSRRSIKMRRECPIYPSDQRLIDSATSIRCISDDTLTIWHRVEVNGENGPYIMLYIIKVLYELASEDLTTETIEWGGWTYSSIDLPDGNLHIGDAGLSSILLYSRNRRTNVILASYLRQRMVNCEHGQRTISVGHALPLPKGALMTRESHRADTAWDDVYGILVVLAPSGAIWILRYA